MMRILIALVCVALFSGCETYKRIPGAPDSVNYTLSRDRMNGDITDYFGASWNLK